MAKKESSQNATEKPARAARKERTFPALTFEEALPIAEAIQQYASGQRVRRLTLFEKLNSNPDSRENRRMVTASGQYGLTKGSYTAEYLELTSDGNEATSEDVPEVKQIQTKFKLAIVMHPPFGFLYTRLKGNKVPAKEVLADWLSEANVELDERAECIDTFILNAKYLGLLRTIAGSERVVPIEQALEEHALSTEVHSEPRPKASPSTPSVKSEILPNVEVSENLDKVCFYITPIGEDGSEERRHADFLMEYIIKPAVKEFDLSVVRADQMGKPGMIGKQVIEHILKSRLVIADLSFHNPNVFYELSLRHVTRLPTVQIKRTVDKIPFDLNQYRTIPIETRDPYTLLPKIQTYTAEIANQVRRALQDSESGDNPISLYYPNAKLTWEN